MQENENPTEPTIGDAIKAQVDEMLEDERVIAAGKHARNLRDRAELFVRDNKVEIGAAVVFIAGVWVGRRGVRKAVAKALNSEEARTTFIDLFGFEPDSRHIVLPPVELEKVKKMAKTGRTMSIQGQGLILTLSAAKN